MLRTIDVSGFRSLNGFHLELKPGLNVLVGANGAGKTNILKFLEFASSLCKNPLSHAVSQSEGARNIFSRTDDLGRKELSFTLCGTSTASTLNRRLTKAQHHTKNPINDTFSFRYYAKIELEQSVVSFCHQEIELNFEGKKSKSKKYRVFFKWEKHTTLPTADAAIDEKSLQMNEAVINYFSPWEYGSVEKIAEGSLRTNIFAENSLINIIPHFFFNPLAAVCKDINSGILFNISPDLVRLPDDIARHPGITSKGGGVASTLLALEKMAGDISDELMFMPGYLSNEFPENSDKLIQKYIKLCDSNIIGVKADFNVLESRTRIILDYDIKGSAVSYPISFVSDGTAKWLSLIIAIVTSTSAFCIEEPENFLHPRLQREIVNIVRAISENAEFDRFALMTTHSETLLNALRPEEIIVTRFINGATECSRPTDPELINEQINETGFGLGHMYLTGVIDS